MKVLVLAAAYPDTNGNIPMYYVHSRNCYYKRNGIEVEVLNFSAVKEYEIDDIKVFGLKKYEEKYSHSKYDLLILHAANIKNHYRFIKKYGAIFPRFLFFFHGHEVLRCSRVYPVPYDYIKKENEAYRTMKDIYDIVKLRFWRKAFQKYLEKSWFVFVSQWMFNEFQKWIGLDGEGLRNQYSVIYNCVGSVFERETYQKESNKKYDYISIRSDFDGSKYGVDIIVRLAKLNPEKSFYLVGRGDYFQYREKPDNLIVEQTYLNHKEMIQVLNMSKCALMPTRTDAQGVSACEIATFGIPLITSDIPVCQEVFAEFSNVAFINNEAENVVIETAYKQIVKQMSSKKNKRYFSENTTGREVELIKNLVEK